MRHHAGGIMKGVWLVLAVLAGCDDGAGQSAGVDGGVGIDAPEQAREHPGEQHRASRPRVSGRAPTGRRAPSGYQARPEAP